jgi:hypothetical protein
MNIAVNNEVNNWKPDHNNSELQWFSIGYPLLSIVFHYFSKLFPISLNVKET